MIRKIKPKKNYKRGFTLIEFMVASAVMAIVVGISATMLSNFFEFNKTIELRLSVIEDVAYLINRFSCKKTNELETCTTNINIFDLNGNKIIDSTNGVSLGKNDYSATCSAGKITLLVKKRGQSSFVPVKGILPICKLN